MNFVKRIIELSVRVLVFAVAALAAASAQAAPLKVFCTLPDLGSLVRSIGGDQVDVVAMIKGGEDPHFIEAKPSFIKKLNEADLFVQNGMELEIGYVGLLLQNARNDRVLPGNPGYLDVSTVIAPLEVPSATVDRSMGDVHPFGNPHYLLDPLNGLQAASAIRDKLSALRPEQRDAFAQRFAAFKSQLDNALVGEGLAKKYEAGKLALLFERGKLDEFLQQQGDTAQLGGWLAAMQPYRGAQFVDDHNMWPYFARRFGLQLLGHLEPKPGVPPTTSHLAELIEQMKSSQTKLIIAAPYYDPRHARFVAENTGAQVAALAHIVGARPGTDDYLAMVDYNVRQIVAALAHSKGSN